jgi:hypothetical protein
VAADRLAAPANGVGPSGTATGDGGPARADAAQGFGPLLRSAVRAAVGDGYPLQSIKQAVGTMAVEEAIRIADGNVRLAARKLGVTDRALHLRGCTSRPASPAHRNGSDLQGVGLS